MNPIELVTGTNLGRFSFVPKLIRLLISRDPKDDDHDLLEPLLPVADRETYQRYASAFGTIIEKAVTCVAVTGPYGAGKTSLINAFIEKYPKLKFIRITEGHLGEDYDDYTSYFHKGATTRADRQYIQRFNKGDEIDFDEKIDTPSEILLILDDGLFGNPALRVALLEERLTTFEEIKDWVFELEELTRLLKSNIPSHVKTRLLKNAGTIECGADGLLLSEVVNILASPDTAISDFDENFVEIIIGAVLGEDAIRLLIRMIPKWEEARVMRNMEAIGPPYEEITEYGKRPKIAQSEVNVALAEALLKKDIISQFKNDERSIRIITKRKDPTE